MVSEFGRLITAMVTPFDQEGQVNISEALSLGQHLMDTGTDTVLLAGTTGESPTLNFDEEQLLFQRFVDAFKGKMKIMAGTGSNSTATAVEMTQMAESLGVDIVLQVAPYYNKPSQEGLYCHFKSVAKATSLPIMLYNIPGRTGVNIEPETVQRLARFDNIVAIKEAAGSVKQVVQLRSLLPDSFCIYSGDDGLTLPFLKEGACGVVSVASHCVGSYIKRMMAAFFDNQHALAFQLNGFLQDLFKVLFIAPNPVPIKALLNHLGFSVGVPRLPLVQATDKDIEKVILTYQRFLKECSL